MSRLIYRDIKPENIGFDIRGDVKVFDFGLCKNLDRDKKAEGYGYKLTPTTGSIPFMAPEVAKGLPYDTKADVFSFSLLLWGILNFTTFICSQDLEGKERERVNRNFLIPSNICVAKVTKLRTNVWMPKNT